MSIHLRKRGEIWYARGTVRVGQEVITVRQFSTGCTAKGDAEAVAADHEAKIRRERLAGPGGRQASYCLNEAFLAYVSRPGGVEQYDKDRIRDMGQRVGDYKISEAAAAWEAWKRMRGASLAPATVARWRAVFVAALTEGCKALSAGTPPAIPGVKVPTDERVVYLTDKEREALLAAYNEKAGPVALVLAYQGLRTQEALRLNWRHVDLTRQSIYIANLGKDSENRTKTRKGRSVPMHPRVHIMLAELWEKMGKPEMGTVFISRRGKPYRDTRGIGGNPLTKAHASACAKAGVTDFRVHDWRHDWASRMVMAGVDLETLRKLGGWSNLRMVSRYASVSQDHMRDSIAKLA